MNLTIDQALQQGIAAHQGGKLQEAERLYKAILDTQPQHPDANHNLGVLAVGVGKASDALPYFKAALEANPKIDQYWLSYIDTLIKLGHMDAARQVLQQGRNAGLKGDKVEGLEAHLSGSNKAQLDGLVALYQQGKYQEVIVQGKVLADQFPNDHIIPNILGAAYSALGNTEAAIEHYNKAIKVKPDYADPYNNLGLTLKGLGRHEEAIQSYNKAIEIQPNYAEAHNNLGALLNSMENYEGALSSYNKAIELRPDYVEAYYNNGNILNKLKRYNDALCHYNKAIKVKPDYAEAYNNLGNTLSVLERREEAISSYNKAIEIQPDYAEAYSNLGNILRVFGQVEKIENNYKKSLTLEPRGAEAYFGLAVIFKEAGRAVEAGLCYLRAIVLKDDFSIARYNLGILYHTSKDYRKAAAQFELVDFEKSKYYLLRCFYYLDEKVRFFDLLDNFIAQGEIDCVIGSLGCRSALRYGIERQNLFCSDPLNYVLKIDLNNDYDFDNIFIKTAHSILDEGRVAKKSQGLLTNGYQTYGNLFDLEPDSTKEIQDVIHAEIEKYRLNFKNSEEGFIKSWPTEYSLYGWLLSMKNGGELRPHMHENGWISGSVYINVPKKKTSDSGNLVVCIEDLPLSGSENKVESIDVITGSLCLFPASLLHYTIPFESDEERIVLAFDVVPKKLLN